MGFLLRLYTTFTAGTKTRQRKSRLWVLTEPVIFAWMKRGRIFCFKFARRNNAPSYSSLCIIAVLVLEEGIYVQG